MGNHQIIKIEDEQDWKRCYPVINEMRKDLSLLEYLRIIKMAKANGGYEMVAIEANHQIVAVMGYRILYDFVHGKHIYIDDLVTTETHRSQGLGAQLLGFAEGIAKQLNCQGLRLCTGIENEPAKKFYEKQGWLLRAVVYKKKLAT